MAERGGQSTAPQPLSGETLYLLGRVQGVTRRRLLQLVKRFGGKLAAKPGAKVTIVAVGHSSSAKVLPDGLVRLPAGLPPSAILISEQEFRRRLGLAGPPAKVERGMSAADIERIAGLSPKTIACLALFDVIEPVDERYSYRDLVAAREAAKLIARGVELRQVIDAALALRKRGNHLGEAKLVEGPSGALLREVEGQLAEFSGQLTMRLDHDARTVDELVAEAEAAEEADDFAVAERLYTTAMRADPDDPVLPFNLGNIFDVEGRPAEAKIAWQIAVARDPAFADAWYNLAMAAEEDEQNDLAIAFYRRAVQAQPDYGNAHFNLALLLTGLDRCKEALPHWERYVELEPHAKQTAIARRAITLCRMHINRDQARTG